MFLIFDELKYAEKLERNGFISGHINKRDLAIYAKYLKLDVKNKAQIESALKRFCKKYEPFFNEILHANYIKFALREIGKNVLRIPIPINITKNELDYIDTLPDIKYKKVLFCILVVAKYLRLNPVRIQKKKEQEQEPKSLQFFYNSSIAKAVKLANVTMTKKQRLEMEHYLFKNGYLEDTVRVTSKLNFVDLDGAPEIIVSKYNDIVLYYEEYKGNSDIISCEMCGDLIKRKNAKHKYCKECYQINHRESKKRWKSNNKCKNNESRPTEK